jgi:hypothetical protein
MKALESAHQVEPFSLDPREAARRVGEITFKHRIAVVQYRGEVGVRSCSEDSVWLAVDESLRDSGRISNPMVIDVARPFSSERFRECFSHYIAGDVSADELVQAAADTSFDDRVLGEFPEGVNYLGAVVWLDRDKTFA